MRHSPIDSRLFVQNRQRLAALLPPRSIALFNANDIPVTNADGTLVPVPNADLFYLSGIEQEETVLLICPDAFDEKHREILFVREPNEHLKIWEGHKHSKDEAIKISGIKTVKWLHEMPTLLKSLVFDSENVFLNTNEHKRADTTVQTRDDRFILDMKHRFPLHQFRRVAPLML